MDDIEQAEIVAAAVADLVHDLAGNKGLSLDLVLSGVHAKSLSMIADVVGGKVAARLAKQAAGQIRRIR